MSSFHVAGRPRGSSQSSRSHHAHAATGTTPPLPHQQHQRKHGKPSSHSHATPAPPDSSGTAKSTPLVAVLLADSFDRRMRPLTLEIPRALLPLCGQPLLEHALEFLAASGVTDVIVLASAHADTISDFISSRGWNSKFGAFRTQVVHTNGCFSVGDALRSVHSLNLVHDTFVLLHADVIASNLDLRNAVQRHIERNQRWSRDGGCLMSMLYKPSPSGTLSAEHFICRPVALQADTGKLLALDLSPTSTDIRSDLHSFDISLLDDCDSVEVRSDLVDCHICICDTDVLSEFSENFDYVSLDSLIRNSLDNEVLGKLLCIDILPDTVYCSRIDGFPSYGRTSMEMMKRWSYPLVPDALSSSCVWTRRNVYREPGILLARDAVIEKDSILGRNCEIGSKTVVSGTVIGSSTRIGSNCRITNSIIWKNCVIEDNTVIDHAIIANNCKIHRDVQIRCGCVLCPHSTIAPHIILKEGSRITACSADELPPDEDDASLLEEDIAGEKLSLNSVKANKTGNFKTESHEDIVGVGGIGRLWGIVDDPNRAYGVLFSDSQRLIREVAAYDSDEDISNGDGSSSPWSVGDNQEDAEVHFINSFVSEVRDTVLRALRDNLSLEDIRPELNNLKFSHYAEIEHFTSRSVDELVGTTLLGSILDHYFSPVLGEMADDRRMGQLGLVFTQLAEALSRWQVHFPRVRGGLRYEMLLLDNLVGMCNGDVTYICNISQDENALLLLRGSFQHIVKFLYDADILSEDGICGWVKQESSDVQFVQQLERLVNWLEEAEEEEEEDDDE